MSEYIKKEDAINKLADEYVFDARSEYEGTFTRADFIDDAKETLADIPSADVVEVVRCKDCMYKHANKNNRQLTCNRRMLGAVRPNDYCSLGAKEDDE